MKRLGKSQRAVLDYLNTRIDEGLFLWTSPTKIGEEAGGMIDTTSGSGSLGKPYLRHSSWASPICLRLVEMGFIERNQHGHYRVKR